MDRGVGADWPSTRRPLRWILRTSPRARCRQLELHADEVLFAPVLTLIREVFYQPDPAERDAARGRPSPPRPRR